ncbi:dipeptide/oligopeptide/nickel ABC transporter permease/ATP-binding protein [Enteractinococcus fodinae]|uniref:ABC-type dipeptide/oligopeptide/nickel transport system ATPase component/ABC-type dipeptide/oligopeptide/nickel transport system permease subunit n=1 Tax=Enteractinococcus fodinae TaxID=684663 RepID=A0ABU2B478_9MICC|nr:dipeptide/oligopeptide/nickel ABC transporter permease/ATP-binding protein [Enteractinococcus fodinae]MDR7348413.1 ABC-type dipeptide/oligopeptide/nickel transport system ATPase component/ABC-type dipeptide/oligopeptide/nickel transport system permease subunit [Enteractinococcus fodinae]
MANPKRSLWSPGLIVGLALLAVLTLIAIFAPMFLQDAANDLTDNRGLPPSSEHWLGTNNFGQDNLARVLVATRLTLLMTLAASAISIGFGLLIGIAIWLAPTKVREFSLRLLETMVAYPTLITALIIAAILQPGAMTAIIAMGVAGIPGFARVTANLAQQVTKSDYFVTAKFLGVPPSKLATRHMIPSMAEPLLVLSTTIFASTLVEISALSFIGLGVQPPQYDLGSLLNDSLDSLYTQPAEAVGPAVLIVVASIGAMLIGDALAAHANPRTTRVWSPRKPQGNPIDNTAQEDTALVRVEDLRVTMPGEGGGTELVHGVSFSIDPGEIIGIVGESGSGKSLTAMTVAGLAPDNLSINAERVRVGTMNMLSTPRPEELAKEISIVYQDPGTTFSPSLKMGGQLTEVLRKHANKGKKESRAIMADALERVGIDRPHDRLDQHPHELSGGMRQRAMISNSVVTSPSLLIADEPTTALDVTVQVDVLRQFRKLREKHGTAILFISHDIGVVQEFCDRVLVMEKGRIVEELQPDQIRTHDVSHPYTRQLLEAVPVLDVEQEIAATEKVRP